MYLGRVVYFSRTIHMVVSDLTSLHRIFGLHNVVARLNVSGRVQCFIIWGFDPTSSEPLFDQ